MLTLDERERRVVAALSDTDVRTLDRLLAGRYVRPLTRGRIVSTLKERGHDVRKLPPMGVMTLRNNGGGDATR